jgi:hypothetical protein
MGGVGSGGFRINAGRPPGRPKGSKDKAPRKRRESVGLDELAKRLRRMAQSDDDRVAVWAMEKLDKIEEKKRDDGTSSESPLARAAKAALEKIRLEGVPGCPKCGEGAVGPREVRGNSPEPAPAEALIRAPFGPIAPPEPAQAKLDPVDAEIEAELAEWDEAHRRGR